MGLVLALALEAWGALSQEAWDSADIARVRREAAGDLQGSLLAATLEHRDFPAMERDMRRLEASSAPRWMRVEALRLLCECSCVMGWTDSLREQGLRFRALSGGPFDCPQAADSPPQGLPPAAESKHWLQCGAYSTEKGAREALKALGRTGMPSRILSQGGLWKVQLGPLASRDAAEKEARRLQEYGRLKEYRVVAP